MLSPVDPSVAIELPGEGRSRETQIRRDASGRWWNDGTPITHPSLVRAFDSWIELADDGRLCLKNDVNWAYVTIEGPPILARGAEPRPDEDGDVEVWLSLSDGRRERLDAATLREGPDGALYCDVRGGTLACRLERPAMMALAELFEEDEGGTALLLGGAVVRPHATRDPLVPTRRAVVEARSR
jgi:hypothetical protein